MSILVTAEEKTNKKNDVKARGLLLMALPNEHQLTFSQYPDAKSMFAGIETRFEGNAATKKTQKALLKQQYENFSATSAESLDSIFNRLQKIVIVWMNKPEVETMSIYDLYNNFKIVKQKVKKTIGTSSGVQNLAFMTAPSFSSTNDANTASLQVSTTSPSINTSSPQVCTVSVSDNIMYAFMVENPNGSNVLHQDLEQIHEDDLEAMDLKWQLSLLSVRAKKYYQRTGKKIFINGNDIAGYDKSKVEAYGPENSKKESNVVCKNESDKSKENSDKSLVKEQVSRVSDDEEQDESMPNPKKKTVIPIAAKIEKPVKKSVRSVNTAHPKTAVHSAKSKTYFSKQAQSIAKIPFYKQTTLTRRSLHEAKRHYYTGSPQHIGFGDLPNLMGKPQLDDKGFVDSGCSRHMIGNIAYLSDFKQFDRCYVAFGGGAYGGKISGKGTLKTDNLDFQDIYFVNELKFNLFSVSQMCDKKSYVLFTNTECLVLSPNFKLPDENQILLKIPRKDNMYSFDMKNIVPKESLTCLVAKATLDESML
ncbi:hypothetical protein Tco_0364239 [Tanacetum coccineum]